MNIPDDEVGLDTPIPLSQAIRIFFPLGGVSKSSLRKEAGRGRLKITRIANKDFVTKRAMEAMIIACEVPPRPAQPAPAAPGLTPDEIEGELARQALREAVKRRPKASQGGKSAEIKAFPKPENKG